MITRRELCSLHVVPLTVNVTRDDNHAQRRIDGSLSDLVHRI